MPIDPIGKLVVEAVGILEAMGIPLAQLSTRRRERVAKAFIAVAGLLPGQAWAEVADASKADKRLSREVLRFMNTHLGERIADSSYDDIRRKDLVLPVDAGVIEKSAGKPNANTNDGTRKYALAPDAANVIKTYGTHRWAESLAHYLQGRETMAQRLSEERRLVRIPVTLAPGIKVTFSPGQHNVLQREIIEEFLPRFGHGAQVLYVGDTANKFLHIQREALTSLGFAELAHDKLPDVVAYSTTKDWLFLVEAVHSANPITELRKQAMENMASGCRAALIFVTAFPDRAAFRKWARDIAWETEVWIADTPDHLIHFNGHKFLGPHTTPNTAST